MKTENFPYIGATVTVRTRSGKEYEGTVMKPHMWAEDAGLLCLARSSVRGQQSAHVADVDGAELFWIYVQADDIEAFTWDCLP